MEVHARAPEPLSNKGPKDKNWQLWKQEFLIFMRASGGIKKTEEEKASFLMNLIGRVGQEALENIQFDDPNEKDNMDILLAKFDEYFDPPQREVEKRYKFFTRSKKNNESIEDYISDLIQKAKVCNFESQTESLVRDMVIRDTKDKYLHQMFLEAKDLDLDKIINLYNSHQINTEKMKEVYQERTNENRSESKPSYKPASRADNNIKVRNIAATKETASGHSQTRVNKDFGCWRCGTKHAPRACPAWNSRCNSCQELNHLTQRCPKNQASNASKSTPSGRADKNVFSPFHQINKNNLKK